MRIERAAMALLASTAAVRGQTILNAHPGPANYGGNSGPALFFDLDALRGPVVVTELQIATSALPGYTFTFELMVRDGTALGGTATTGPGTSLVGWTRLGTVHGVQGSQNGGISLPIDIPDFIVFPGVIRGVALWTNTDWGVRCVRISASPYSVYQDDSVKLTTGDMRSDPFTALGQVARSWILTGSITYFPVGPCYPNCDGSTQPPILNVSDFVCFQAAFAAGAPYANCDQSTGAPALNVLDFVCFMQQFAAGCP
jgi:hypothetical protein